jgi:transposase InsO family protein
MKRRHRRSSGGFPPAPRSFVAIEPNDLWTVDFKGWWRTLDGTRCDPLTVRDSVSRYVLAMRVLSRTRTEDVRPVFEELFDRFGVPKAIGSDNGPPFASLRGPGGLTQLSAWWVSLGIQVVRSRPGHPQDNGAHERMHVDVRIDLEDYAAPTLLAQCLRRLDHDVQSRSASRGARATRTGRGLPRERTAPLSMRTACSSRRMLRGRDQPPGLRERQRATRLRQLCAHRLEGGPSTAR